MKELISKLKSNKIFNFIKDLLEFLNKPNNLMFYILGSFLSVVIDNNFIKDVPVDNYGYYLVIYILILSIVLFFKAGKDNEETINNKIKNEILEDILNEERLYLYTLTDFYPEEMLEYLKSEIYNKFNRHKEHFGDKKAVEYILSLTIDGSNINSRIELYCTKKFAKNYLTTFVTYLKIELRKEKLKNLNNI